MDLVGELFRHNTMMNARLADACKPLTPEQLGHTVRGTYGPLGATLVHTANAQLSYAARLFGEERPEPMAHDPLPPIDAIAARLADGDRRLERAAAEVDLDREIEVVGTDPPGRWRLRVGLFLLQAINHATEHRSQIATILTDLGIEPPEMDGWTYFLDSGQMVDV